MFVYKNSFKCFIIYKLLKNYLPSLFKEISMVDKP